MVFQIVYMSSASRLLGPRDIESILAHARIRNAAEGITGLLMYHDGNFFQALEGPEASVEACYARIVRDPRHHALFPVCGGPARKRLFTDWRMGYRKPAELGAEAQEAVLALHDLLPRFRGRNGAIAERFARQFLESFRDISRAA